jgi:hypothetical protein
VPLSGSPGLNLAIFQRVDGFGMDPSGRYLVGMLSDGTLRLYDLQSRRLTAGTSKVR